jgi:NAD(P)H-quinone oxidoreductase subunit 5
MTEQLIFLPSHNAVVLCVASILYFLGGIGGLLASSNKITVSRAWDLARVASTGSLIFSLACCFDALLHLPALMGKQRIDFIARIHSISFSFRFDLIESLMLLLVAFLGWVIVSYSRTYMAGDPNEPAYIGHLLRTLAAVSLLVVTNNLILFLVAWVLTSLSLHGLLTLYPGRQAAVIAAHKKFLASRLGDFTLLCGVVLLGSKAGSFELNEVADQITSLHSVPAPIHIAAFLMAVSAIIKCAQLPLHGWLIQVMEAPTPVSALLHAGIVNLGGFMLIRLAPVINTTPTAQGLLVVIGCLTSTISSLVMTTRISIKVNLAWSTCAQMGFMLMECGLGLYDLAFLHLLAHSLYKAYAFLASGGAVNQAKLKRMMPPATRVRMATVMVGCIGGLSVSTVGALLWRSDLRIDANTLFCILVVGIAMAGIITTVLSAQSLATTIILSILAVGISTLYFGYETLFVRILPVDIRHRTPHSPDLFFAAMCFIILYAVQIVIRVKPLGRFATALYPWFYAGLYLDEVFTRATFRIWPASQASQLTRRRDVTEPFEVRKVQL